MEVLIAAANEELPAFVYVRGFVKEFARSLGLAHKEVVESYLARAQAQRP